ncbi:hypothetical protein VKT23_009960 [Stygiomarasmius scandens]|uniref:Uncharacterized protein n=1 Tax=Marasmiellus scandens TaxID=2682957 RepID=A0ABR1JG01_9AGAR
MASSFRQILKGENQEECLRSIEDVEEIKRAARKYVIMHRLWLTDNSLLFFQREFDPDFAETNRFESNESKVQGEFHDLRALIPEKLHGEIKKKWFRNKFLEAMKEQRSNTSTRVRNQAPEQIFGSSAAEQMDDSSSRKNMFKDDIGYQEARDGKGPYYATFHLFSVLIRGKNAPKGLMEGKWSMPRTEIMQHKLNISYMTPGAIANSAVLARWAHSADRNLTAIGEATGINYKAEFEAYLQKILEGLHGKKRWAKDLFQYWDSIMFPDQPSRYGGQSLEGTQQRREEEKNEVFDEDVSSVVSCKQTVKSEDNRSSKRMTTVMETVMEMGLGYLVPRAVSAMATVCRKKA